MGRRHRSRDRKRSRSRSHSRGHRGRHHRSDKHHRSDRDRQTQANLPDCPSGFECRACSRSHWTTECPLVRRDPDRYPYVHRNHGCASCGERGHGYLKCYRMEANNHGKPGSAKCRGCGGAHPTSDCPYDHVPVEWHQFYDAARDRIFFCNAETQAVTWSEPHRFDTVLWHCDGCKVVLPLATPECVLCHKKQPHSGMHAKEDDEVSASGSEGGSESDDSIPSSSSSCSLQEDGSNISTSRGASSGPIAAAA